MEQKVMNRWIIVVGAILIQLSLGAIYAWSVFTTPLVAPLPDNDFLDISEDGGITVEVVGDLLVGDNANITLIFTEDGVNTIDITNLTVTLELKDDSNEPVEDDKVVQFVGIVYQKGDPITAGPYTTVLDEDHFNITAKVSKPGNWHFVIEGKSRDDLNVTTHNFEVLQKVETGKYGFSISQTQLIFATGLFFFALFTIFGGRLSKKFGPRNIAITGGAVLGAGYILASFMGTSFIGILVTIGVLGGIGIGLAYVVPIAVGVKWFPDKKGLISGLAVAGFGFGALLWIKLCNGFVFGPIDLTPGWTGFFGDGLTVSNVFLIYGIAFAVAVIFGGFLMKNPPEDWKPKGWEPPVKKDDDKAEATGNEEFTSKEM
ncbi:MAG: MFS transporter, partial [Candidatus Thermoplasmatota archaeon]|nr:MFS transporter [Candidatus Thermoplasmatota archaeon]